MNLFADLLAATQKEQGQLPQSVVTQTGPRIQKSRRGVEVKSAREIETMRQASRIVATVLREIMELAQPGMTTGCLLYTSPSPRDLSTSRMPSSA